MRTEAKTHTIVYKYKMEVPYSEAATEESKLFVASPQKMHFFLALLLLLLLQSLLWLSLLLSLSLLSLLLLLLLSLLSLFLSHASGGRRCALPPNPPPAFLFLKWHLLRSCRCCCCCCCCVKIHAHFPHGCGTHFTVHTYFYTLAQGVKGCTRVESKLHVLTSGLSAVSDC